jgi:hypothetical protein
MASKAQRRSLVSSCARKHLLAFHGTLLFLSVQGFGFLSPVCTRNYRIEYRQDLFDDKVESVAFRRLTTTKHRSKFWSRIRSTRLLEDKNSDVATIVSETLAPNHRIIEEQEIEEWENYANELRQFKEQNGDCLVPTSYDMKHNSTLAAWVQTQREQLILWRKNVSNTTVIRATTLTRDRVKMLSKLGFHWHVLDADHVWDKFLNYLVQNITQPPVGETKLFNEWNAHQREEYRRYKWKRISSMTKDRVDKLIEADFDFKRQVPKLSWEEGLERLNEFKEWNGHCRVPARYETNPELGSWVKDTRKAYKKYANGEPSNALDQARIAKLEAVGFDWELKKGKPLKSWDERFKELCAFKDTFGHCNVPTQFKEITGLFEWVMTHRKNYRFFHEGKDATITEEQIRKLEAIGFEWQLFTKPDWDDQYDELVAYQNRYGDYNVPQSYIQNPKLGRWLTVQRQAYKEFQTGQKSGLTAERVAKLNRLDDNGFQASVNADWYDRFEELKVYKDTYGDFRVPGANLKDSDTYQLALWVQKQRRNFKLLQEGKKLYMTEDRIQKLNEIGFEWSVHSWSVRYEELKAFQKQHGHCRVPGAKLKDSDTYQLANWVQTQRRKFKLLQEGKKSYVTEERLRKLNEVGFEWSLR